MSINTATPLKHVYIYIIYCKGGTGRGQGEQFNKQGRVNWSLARRLHLLEKVQLLGQSLGVSGDVGYTCESAHYFYINTVKTLMQGFESACQNSAVKSVASIFPFQSFFLQLSASHNTGSSSSGFSLLTNSDNADFDADLETARSSVRYVNKIFEELADYRSFEVLRNHTLRSDYLLTKQVSIYYITLYLSYMYMYVYVYV